MEGLSAFTGIRKRLENWLNLRKKSCAWAAFEKPVQ
jgi:hypothetical protein